jgi:uncharacterized protein YjgD (DUF1641 family)
MMNDNLELLTQKIDTLTEQVAYLTQQAKVQQRRQQAFDELKDDMIPIANHMIKLSIDELAEIGDEFQFEDFSFLMKRLLRNTHLIMEMFDRLEAIMGIADESAILGKQVFNYAVEQLDYYEREGYFKFAREGGRILEKIVSEFSPEDVQALGDNIVIILNTVKNMTQPQIMALANNAVGAIQLEVPVDEKISTWTMLRELSNPQVRRGLVRMINLLKALDQGTNDKST